MWRIFNGISLFLLCCGFSLGIFNTCSAQYPMGDTSIIAQKNLIHYNDSIRKYTIAHIDTTFVDFTKIFHPTNFVSSLPVEKMQIQTPQINYKFSWFMLIIIICIIIVTFVKLFYQNYYNVLFSYIYSFQLYTTSRDLGSLNNLGTFLLNIVYILSVSMSLYFITIYFFPTIQDKSTLYFIILAVFSIHYLYKIISLYFLELFIKNKNTVDFYIKSISRTNQFMALCILFILFIYLTGAKSHDEFIVYLLIIVLVLGQIMKYIKGLLSNIQQITNYFFHFIIYICTLEIAPLLILYKLFIRHV
ncbi:MAG: DUF4271 domain-containing protein [Bacteroidota bacterium]